MHICWTIKIFSYPHGLQQMLQRLQNFALHFVNLFVIVLQFLLLRAHVAHSRDLIQQRPKVLQGVSDPLRVVQH